MAMNSAPRFALILGSAAALSLTAHVNAQAATFDFATGSPVSSSSKAVTVGGNTFTLSNPVWTTSPAVVDGIRANATGVCAWASIGSTTGRCNVNPIDGQGSTGYAGATLNGLSGSVSQSSYLKSFTIGQFASPTSISNASIAFRIGGTIMESINITGETVYNLSTPILLAAGQNFDILTSGTSSDTAAGSSIRISTFDIDVKAPGPLPLLGASAAFGWSRKLRRQVKKAQAN